MKNVSHPNRSLVKLSAWQQMDSWLKVEPVSSSPARVALAS